MKKKAPYELKYLLVALLTAGIFILDVKTPVGFVAWLLYLVPILLICRTSNKRHIIIFTSICTALMFIGLIMSPPGVEQKYGLMTCILDVFVFWLTPVFYLNYVQVAESLRESEAKYYLLFQKNPIGVFNYDTRLQITDCNDSFIDILQSRRNVLIGLDMEYLTDQRVLPALVEAIRGNDGIYEGFYQATTSQVGIYIKMLTAPVYDRHGNIKGGVGIVTDVTEQAKMKDSLRDQKKFTDNLIENSAVATFVLDTRHKIVLWNKACEELTGFSSADMIGTDNQWRPFYEKKRPTLADIVIDADFDELPALYPSYAKSALSPDALHSAGWRFNLHGKEDIFFSNAAPLYDSKGVLIAVIQTVEDRTSLSANPPKMKLSGTLIRKRL